MNGRFLTRFPTGHFGHDKLALDNQAYPLAAREGVLTVPQARSEFPGPNGQI
jgi:hypothetical protein